MHSRYDGFHHSLCTNDELVTVTDRVDTEIKNNITEDEFLTTETGLAKSESATITTLNGRSHSGEFTTDIELSDKKRDTLLRVIKRKLKSDIDLIEYDPEAAAGAKIVKKLMRDNYVDLRAGYSEESAQINTLIANSKTSVYSDAILVTSAAVLFTKLEEEQTTFEDLVHQQAQANSEVPTGEVKKHVANMVFRLEGILSYLERKAMSHVQYETAAANIQEMLNSIMAPARARATKKENEKTPAA